MLSKVLAALTLVRHAVAITVVTGAATTMVAGTLDAAPAHTNTAPTATPLVTATTAPTERPTKELYGLVTACLATKDPQSEACAKALDASGLDVADFWAKVAFSLHDQIEQIQREPKPTKEPERTAKPSMPATGDELYALVKDCLAKYASAKTTPNGPALASEACHRAIDASGLTADEFWARFAPKASATEQPRTKPTPSATPKPTQTVTDAELRALVSDCFTKYTYATATHSAEAGTAAADACKRAIAASGLSGDAFWAKFGTPVAVPKQ